MDRGAEFDGVRDDDQVHRSHQGHLRVGAEPDIRPLGGLAIGAAVLSLLFAASYFLSPLAYLAAVPAVALGVAARSDERVRGMGNAALTFAVIAVVWATVVIVVSF